MPGTSLDDLDEGTVCVFAASDVDGAALRRVP